MPILAAACGLAAAQTPILVGYGDVPEPDNLGSSVAVVGDVNGDGHDDIVVGVPDDGEGFEWYHGEARVLSGLDGSELLHWEGANQYDRLGVSVAGVGDLDGDGVPDVLVGAPQRNLFGGWIGPGFADLYSGADGHLIQHFDGAALGDEFGSCVAQVGDLDGDGLKEFAIGAPKRDTTQTDGGQLTVYSGATLLPLHAFTFNGPIKSGRLGTSAGDAGDVDLDGVPDLLVGAPLEIGWAKWGHVYVYSGASGGLLLDVAGGGIDDLFGTSVCGLGDVDGDARADFAGGAPGWNVNRVKICSGATGATLFTVQGGTGVANFGCALAPAGDLNSDGIPDLVVGAEGGVGYVSLVSGADGGVLWRFFGPPGGYGFGYCLAAGGDLDADGHADLVVGEPHWDPEPGGEVGRVNGYSLAPWIGLGYGLAGAKLPPALWAEGKLAGGTLLTLRLAAAPASAPVALVVGFSALLAPFKGGTLVPNPTLVVLGLVASPDGQLTLSTTWPAGVPAGVELYLQAWVVDPTGPAGFAASPAIVGVTP